MNKNIIIAVVVIIVIVGGFFLFTNRAEAPEGQLPINTSENTPPETDTVMAESEDDTNASQEDVSTLPDEQDPSVTVVTYTDDGFDAESVTISKGDTVRFLNESSGRMWVGADIHPTHSLYPIKSDSDCLGSSFDQCRASVNGESWEFTFTEVGEWRYHNHVRASKRGTVIVK